MSASNVKSNIRQKAKHKKNVHYISKITCKLLILCLIAYLFMGKGGSNQVDASSADTADLRFIFTTDLHGQLNNMDYEVGNSFTIGGLTKAYTLIKEARKEVNSNNYLTFDIGDVLYDYSTEYIFSADQKAVQPIYQAMKKVGYDAITLGNHDFDYGYDYITSQIKNAGLEDITVVSNVYDSITGKSVWNENMILTRKVTTDSGQTATVKVGVIGETIPVLSTKTESYLGILKTEDIVENVKKQAATLKKKGADVVVVLAHSGFGSEEPDLNYKNVSYAITQIADVDAVLCGHEHKLFPSTDKTTTYYALPGVDKETSLVNGKVLVMANDRGKSIGIADMKLHISSSGKVTVASSKGEVRQVDKNNTATDNSLNKYYGDWENKLLDYTKKEVAVLDSNTSLTSYLGLVQDNASIQLVNDAKISYAQKYVKTVKTDYQNYPVIAASQYYKYGVNSINDYANISGSITESELAQIQAYNGYTALYKITGKQLREWLEWIASAYETTYQENVSSDAVMAGLIQSGTSKLLISDEWQNSWGNFRVFDGIEYSISPANKPRYDYNGNKINNTNRITKLSYNGQNITDTMEFILATEIITKTTEATTNLDNQAIYKGYNRSQIIVSNYLAECGKLGKVQYTADNNWNIVVPGGYTFLIKSPQASENFAKKSNWFLKVASSVEGMSYIQGDGSILSNITSTPTIILTSTNTATTNKAVTVLVNAYSGQGVSELRFAYGDYSVNSTIWDSATSVVNGRFTVPGNGIYTVYVKDGRGNAAVRKINVNNITDKELEAPKVNTYTNRKTKITGTAEPGAIIHFVASTGLYKHVVAADGTFSYALPSQPSGTIVQVYVEDASGRTSARTKVKVKRTGPNASLLDAIKNNTKGITGNINDSDATLIAIVDETVYVAKNGGKASYIASEIYNKEYTIKEVTQTIDRDLNIKLNIPILKPGVAVKIYSIDHLGRASRAQNLKVVSAGPNTPSVYEIMDIERTIYGRVTSAEASTQFKVYVTVGSKTYSGTTDEKGYYAVSVGKLTAKQSVKVYATDVINGKTRKSYSKTATVGSVNDYLATGGDTFFLDTITNKMTSISIYQEPQEDVYVSINKTVYEGITNEAGEFVLDLNKKIAAGTKIYAFTRFTNGGIYQVESIKVIADVPMVPYTMNKSITTHTKTIKMVTDEKCTVVMKVGDDKYTKTSGTYDSSIDGYVYSFSIPRTNASKTISVYAKNSVGASKSVKLSIVETAPNAPKVDAVHASDETITGTVHLIAPDILGENEDVTAKNTKTVVYAKIGSKQYTGEVDDDGNYVIKIPKQKAGTKIKVWGSNKAGGAGPIKEITVKK
ncbi:Ig-like domain-containing protein [Anaerosporobacter faecicola]|uniref:Ig-like domain-containing protein n=1 Tax=Anaerosporobacter faecicola TaxID=2718714 RepID=UPI00143B42A3|nr:Ig-like domain-containing protein [Anaerosporobacter faecicola]